MQSSISQWVSSAQPDCDWGSGRANHGICAQRQNQGDFVSARLLLPA
jgi:hypothetical protein